MSFVDLTPAKRDSPGPVCALLDQRFVELAPGPGVDLGPTLLAVVLQTGDVGAEKRSKLATTPGSLALVTHLVVQNIGLDLHLSTSKQHNYIVLHNADLLSLNNNIYR